MKCEIEKATELIDKSIESFYQAMSEEGFSLSETIEQIKIIVDDNIKNIEEEVANAGNQD